MTDQTRLENRIRFMTWSGLTLVVATALVWFAVPAWRHFTSGLLIGDFGGVYVVYSLIRQGHRNDNVAGAALFASGIVGMVTRFVVLGLVIFIAARMKVSVVGALVGYLLGFLLVFAGLVGYVRQRGAGEGR